MTEKTKFTKREWIHLIITLSIIQAAIWFISFVYADNSSALGYVSFAGTLISIILAVLAIGYTYGESHQQKSTSVTFANQLDSLVKIKDDLKIQADALESMQNLKNDMTTFKQEVLNNFFETKNKIESNNGYIQNLINSNELIKKNINKENDGDHKQSSIEIVFSENEIDIFQIGFVITIGYIKSRDVSYTEKDIWLYMNSDSNLNKLFTDGKSLGFALYATSLVVFNLFIKLNALNETVIHPFLEQRFNEYLHDLKDNELVDSEVSLKNYIAALKR